MYRLEVSSDNPDSPIVLLDVEADDYSVENLVLNSCLDQTMRFYNYDNKHLSNRRMKEIVLMISVKRVRKLTEINVVHRA